MTAVESAELLSILFGCYLSGWFFGYGIHVIKVFMEKI